ncbi:NAD(+)/NADH kinase [Clostridium gasigenes]|uniref:NAD kinase n=1 Tax=Clostridium gasigenes TaxID=94869 RepID=A0A1H0MZK2_9CLOT|nr:NAD(+)/NADH kinase [Clostridium gasigenes]MBB6625190.1 NAD(+)/NADH kinase [Clostridium gasigenes]MBB6716194.1 NAD(+)/NADH kinase [Clostridium gasigenes]MBU3087382.1 NAD(+)/NADH kinase [Clostridium gasigenes]MBU3102911.1 NAD(+)/NADH kinase [Clostridium gasigenes]MBU3106621.1 NAD(+)/NADH kinase [Clostridium gasigenes]
MKNIIIAINPLKDKGNKILDLVLEKVKKVFTDSKIVVLDSYKISDYDFKEEIDIIMVLGGDGTILGVARELIGRSNAPIIGINIGNLGFLSSVEISGLDMAMDKLKNGKYKIQNRMMLECNLAIKEIKNSRNALNDIVVARGTLSRMVKFQVFIDGKRYYTFKGDGIIIATPTGSTAYSFSAGGPFVYPDVDVITVTPICAHTKGMQTIVLNSDSEIEIMAENGEEEIYITFDGQKAIKSNKEALIKIKKSKEYAKIVLFDDYDYFKVLRTKILNNSKECEGD